MTARRFDPNDSETWPPLDVEVLVQHDNGTFFLAARTDVYRSPTWLDRTRDIVRAQPCENTSWMPLPSFAEPAEDTVDVRIAVAVAPDGDWGALGYITEDDSGRILSDEASDMLDLGVKPQVCFVTARVPAYRPPAVAEIAGEVSDG